MKVIDIKPRWQYCINPSCWTCTRDDKQVITWKKSLQTEEENRNNNCNKPIIYL